MVIARLKSRRPRTASTACSTLYGPAISAKPRSCVYCYGETFMHASVRYISPMLFRWFHFPYISECLFVPLIGWPSTLDISACPWIPLTSAAIRSSTASSPRSLRCLPTSCPRFSWRAVLGDPSCPLSSSSEEDFCFCCSWFLKVRAHTQYCQNTFGMDHRIWGFRFKNEPYI